MFSAFSAMSLTGDTSAQCLFFLYGTGANGKSTLAQRVARAFLARTSAVRPRLRRSWRGQISQGQLQNSRVSEGRALS